MKDTRNFGALRSHESLFETFPDFLPEKSTDPLFLSLMENTPWNTEVVSMFGRVIETRREVAFFGTEPFSYGYTGTRHQAMPLPPDLDEVLTAVRALTDANFNSVLATRYPDGKAGLGWHRDDEVELGPRKDIQIASLSLGARRHFEIRDTLTQACQRFTLESGTLFMMRPGFQDRYQHRVPKDPHITTPRINLSFRTLYPRPIP